MHMLISVFSSRYRGASKSPYRHGTEKCLGSLQGPFTEGYLQILCETSTEKGLCKAPIEKELSKGSMERGFICAHTNTGMLHKTPIEMGVCKAPRTLLGLHKAPVVKMLCKPCRCFTKILQRRGFARAS